MTKKKDLQIFVRKPEKPLNNEEIYSTLKMLNSLSKKIWLEVNFPNIPHINTYTDLSLSFWHGSTELPALCNCSAQRLLVVNDLEKLSDDTLLKFLDSHEKSNRLVSIFSPGINFEIHINKPLLILIEVEPTRVFLESLSFTKKAQILFNNGRIKNVLKLAASLLNRVPNWLPVNLIYSFYYWLRNHYHKNLMTKRLLSHKIIEEGSLVLNSDKNNALGMIEFNLISPEQTNVYTGDKLEVKRYLVDRISDFYPFPKTICLVLTNRCNLKCGHCPFYSPKYVSSRSTNFFDELREVDLKKFECLAKEAGKYGVLFHIGTMEEPALHPQLSTIIYIAKKCNTRVSIATNGLLLKPKLSEEIIRAGLDYISFSIDAATQKTYKAIRGGNYNALVKNIDEFIRLRNKYRPKLRIEVTMIMQDKSRNEWEDFYKFWKSKGVDSIVQYQLFEGKEDGSFEVNKDRKFNHQPERLSCFYLWDICFVYPDGEVSLCCTTLNWIPRMDINKLSVGNVKEMSLQEIWLSENYQKKRLANIEGNWAEVPYCESCNMWTDHHPTIELVDGNTIRMSTENQLKIRF
jgi:MoaA/NifB/PqqE/SkfB family radical SAM enzyme